ncbi:MAG: universal stress protein [Halanaerobiales bacterium]|nr:universal stress protein [Halanaerobiales bacterium]
MEKLLVAVDGSKSSMKAAEKAAELNKSLKYEVTIITVMETRDIEIKNIDTYTPNTTTEELRNLNKEHLAERGEEILEKAADFFKSDKVKKVVKFGNPAYIICDYAEEKSIDIIILADKGIGGVKRFFLGSISDKVMRHSKSSVLIVR